MAREAAKKHVILQDEGISSEGVSEDDTEQKLKPEYEGM